MQETRLIFGSGAPDPKRGEAGLKNEFPTVIKKRAGTGAFFRSLSISNHLTNKA